jgi:hypothetical protein
MRTTVITLVLLGIAATAAAQSRERGLTDDMPTPSIGLPLPHIGLPLPTIGLPLPQMGLPPERFQRRERPDPFDRTQRRERPGRSESSEGSGQSQRGGSAFFFVPFYGWPYSPVTAYPSVPSVTPPIKRATGRVHLVLHSGVDPQIFVDGYYMGLFSDVVGELTLEVGAHTIELREEGYETARVPVNIPLDGVITYDVNLRRREPVPVSAAASSSPAVTAPAPTTIYVVPGCYVGNVPPRQVTLPADCDPRRAITFPSRP